MAENLPDPKSRKESYLAKAAGMDVEIPEKPESREEQYLNAIAEGGGGGGGGGPTVVQTTGTSTTNVMSQNATSSMVFADPAAQVNIKIGDRSSVLQPSGCVTIGERASGGRDAVTIGGQATGGVSGGVTIGHSASGTSNSVVIGYSANSGNRSEGVAIGHSASTGSVHPGSVALGAYAVCTRAGEVYIGSSNTSYGYNTTTYRVLGGVHDPIDAHDAATKGYVDSNAVGTTETFTKAAADWGALSASSPYTYSTTVTLATTLGNDSEVELINDQLVAFANYGFGILSISGQVATIASIGQPDSSITFKIKVRG